MIHILNGRAEWIDRREVLRYLGYGGVSDISGVEAVYDQCERMLLPVLSPRACYALFPLRFDEEPNGTILDLGFARTTSRSLALNLAGCDRIALFAATVGPGVDRLIVKYNKLSPARAVILQAMGAAAVESFCDEVNRQITNEYGATRPRFSCGYGDLPLTLQRNIFEALSVTKHLGITLTEGDLMMPSKSVTAIVGIKKENFSKETDV